MKRTIFTVNTPKVESNTFDWECFKKTLKQSQLRQKHLKNLKSCDKK